MRYAPPVAVSNDHAPRPFADVVTERKHELGLSFRAIADRTRESDDEEHRGLSSAYLVQLFNGNEDPVPRAIRLIAGALELKPENFVEYHLHLMRDALDERVDFQRAVDSMHLVLQGLKPDEQASLTRERPGHLRGRRRRYAVSR